MVELGGVGGVAGFPGQEVGACGADEPAVGGDLPGAVGVGDGGDEAVGSGEGDGVLVPGVDGEGLQVFGGEVFGPQLPVEGVPVGFAAPAFEVAEFGGAQEGPFVGEDVLLVVPEEADQL
ncbi:hypothetical protein GCM10020000_61020 [Streptomyces olivoverticillatus]